MSTPQLTRSMLAEGMFYLNTAPLSLDDYKFMRPVYDSLHPSIVLNTSRQISKCNLSSFQLRTSDGHLKRVDELIPGESILSFNEDNQKVVLNKVKHVNDNGKKPIYHIKTRTGRDLKLTGEHPLWTLNPKWTEAKDLAVGDLIGLSKNNSAICPTEKTVPDHEYQILSYLLMEGGISGRSVGFTNESIENIEDFSRAIENFNSNLELREKPSKPGQFSVVNKCRPVRNTMKKWLTGLALMGKKSDTKFFPSLFFKLTKEQILDAMRIIWNTDGYIGLTKKGFPNIGIGLISKDLIYGIQELLLRIGIHSSISINDPKIYVGTNKRVYVLRIEGAESRKAFYNSIKTFKLKAYKQTFENNNRLVVPKKALQPLLNGLKKDFGGKHKNSLYSKSLSWTLGYDISYTKLKKLNDSLKNSHIQTILEADIIYDKIISIEILPDQSTTSIEMESPHNTFLVNDIITHNSTTLANIMIANSILYKGFRTLYISPTVDQTKIFSNDRVQTVMDQTPYIKKHLMSSALNQNVFTKQMLNHSKMYMRYALQSADRLRGISADANFFDEVQDLLPDIIPVVQETMSRSMYKWSMFSGTPKTSTTTLARLWAESTKNEWMVKCQNHPDHGGCKKWNILDDKNLGDFGVICRYCGKPLDTKDGVWAQTGDPNAIHQGFRINVLMFAGAPWIDWKRDITDYRKQHSEGVFFNEKLGLEYDSGSKPITLAEVKACCTGGPMLDRPDRIIGSMPTYMGLDYGPTNSTKSNTVMTVLQNDGDKLKVVYAKKYLGPEADYGYIHDDIPKQKGKWNSLLIGADYGLGEAPNAEIRKRTAFDRVIAYQHVPNQKDRSMWNTKMPAFTLNRSQVMTEYFSMIKHRKIIFPRWEDFEPFAMDIMNINTDYDEERGKVRYTNNDPDDFFQALIYGGETAIRHKSASAEVY